VEEFSPGVHDACFTKLRISGIPATGTIADVAKLTPKASTITIRPATDALSEADAKVAAVSFTNQEDCVSTFKAAKSAEIQGKAVCVSLGRKIDGNATRKVKHQVPAGRKNPVQGFGAKGKGRGMKRKKSASE
jgi:hypothetical protein